MRRWKVGQPTGNAIKNMKLQPNSTPLIPEIPVCGVFNRSLCCIATITITTATPAAQA